MQAQTNAQSRLLVFAGSRIPADDTVKHFDLLAALCQRLQELSEAGDYDLVNADCIERCQPCADPHSLNARQLLLLEPVSHPPAVTQIVSAYTSLDYETRKRADCIHILGGGWWFSVSRSRYLCFGISDSGVIAY